MGDVEWNEGMSVGVESMDQDHKVLLLLINEINEAINNDSTHLLIKRIFEKLEKYIKEHFSKEEQLMQQCNYENLEEHKKEHSKFINKIPELRKQLLNTDSIEVAQNAYLFLVDWLMQHIIVDDMSYAQTIHDYGLATIKSPKKTFFQRVFAWIGKKVSLNKRLFFNTLVPISSFVVLCTFIFWYGFQQMNNIQQTLELTNTVRNVYMLTDSLQLERNSTLNHINSNYLDYQDKLSVHRNNTNIALSKYQKNVSVLSQQLISDDMVRHINNSQKRLAKLDAQRTEIDDRLSVIDNIDEYYNSTVEHLLTIYETMILSDIDANLRRSINAISVIINLTNVVEQERVLVISLLDKKQETKNKYQQLSMLMGKQQGLLNTFKNLLSAQQQKAWGKLTNSEVFINVKELETEISIINSTENLSKTNDLQWLSIMSSKKDLLNLFIEKLIVDTENFIDKKVKSFERLAIYIVAVLLFVILATIFICWLLTQSIISPIRTITQAMTRLSQGHRDVRFTNNIYHDEIGKIIDGYEYSRRKLLQADISSTVGTMKQSVSLSQTESEKLIYQQLASLDPLTGVINRRKFNELAEQELIRVKRYKHNLALMMIDIDHFKMTNDTYGHESGERVLQEFCQICGVILRKTDVFSRIGREEFVILLPETKLQQAHALAERICEAIESHTVIIDETKIKFTVSIGVTAWDETIGVMSSLIGKADEALYGAKISGRNRVVTK